MERKVCFLFISHQMLFSMVPKIILSSKLYFLKYTYQGQIGNIVGEKVVFQNESFIKVSSGPLLNKNASPFILIMLKAHGNSAV